MLQLPSTTPCDGPPDEEAVLIDRAKRGDRTAFAALYERYERPIYSLIYRMTGNADDAGDLTQEVFLRAYRALGRTRAEVNMRAWLHRIAANACCDLYRQRGRRACVPWESRRHDPLLVSPLPDDPEQAAISQELRCAVQRVLDRMSPRHRLALLLREYDGLSYDEIGQVMGLGSGGVKSLLFRAREEFRLASRGVIQPDHVATESGGAPR